jgi:general secretion pathway protein A
MMKASGRFLCKVGILLCLLVVAGLAYAQNCKDIEKDKAETTARYIADIIVAGRGIVAVNQGLINDPAKGDKGFTPEVVASQIRAKFKEMTGKDISSLDPETRGILDQVIKAAMMSVAMNQKRINQKGKGFKGYIPAVFGRETGQILKGRCNIFIKQTTFKYRNAYNQPDSFEKKILEKFERSDYPKGEGYGEFVGNKYRYLRPIYIKQACLKCHGEPKGSIDPAGRKREGYKVGDLRGAISVMFPVK